MNRLVKFSFARRTGNLVPQSLVNDTRGSEIAEAAFILPLVFLFLFAILWFGRAFNTWSTITSAAREGARTAARPTCASCPPPAPQWSGTNLPGNQTVVNAVDSVLLASRVDPSQIQLYVPTGAQAPLPCTSPPAPPAPGNSSCSSLNNITICRFVVLNGTDTPQQCGTIVSFKYPFGSGIPFPSAPTFSFQSVTMSTVGQSLMQY